MENGFFVSVEVIKLLVDFGNKIIESNTKIAEKSLDIGERIGNRMLDMGDKALGMFKEYADEENKRTAIRSAVETARMNCELERMKLKLEEDKFELELKKKKEENK